MILSMTGYGKSVRTYGEKKINVEIKSLNSKNLDLSTRIAPLQREGDGNPPIGGTTIRTWQD